MGRTVTLFDQSFRLIDDPADMEWAFLEFAEAANDTDAASTAGAAAVMRLLEAAVHPEDWQAFKTCARKNRARTERDLMPVVVAATQAREEAVAEATDRPTPPPTASSDGPTPTDTRSTGGSSPLDTRPRDEFQKHIDRLNGEGRRDLAQVVAIARSHKTA